MKNYGQANYYVDLLYRLFDACNNRLHNRKNIKFKGEKRK